MNKYHQLLKILRYTTTIILFGMMQYGWARKPYLKSGHIISIPSIGLKMKMPKYAKPNPAKSVTRRTLTQRRGNQIRKIEVYLLEELWLREQLSGSYGNQNFMVTIYEMRLPAPSNVKAIFKKNSNTFVVKTVYEQWLEIQKKVTWDIKNMQLWLRYLITDNLGNNIKLVKKTLSNSTVIYYVDSAEQHKLKPTYILVSPNSPVRHVVIQFKLSPLLDFKKSSKTIKKCLNSVTFHSPVKLKNSAKKMTV